jgi:hypothetical protein
MLHEEDFSQAQPVVITQSHKEWSKEYVCLLNKVIPLERYAQIYL